MIAFTSCCHSSTRDSRIERSTDSPPLVSTDYRTYSSTDYTTLCYSSPHVILFDGLETSIKPWQRHRTCSCFTFASLLVLQSRVCLSLFLVSKPMSGTSRIPYTNYCKDMRACLMTLVYTWYMWLLHHARMEFFGISSCIIAALLRDGLCKGCVGGHRLFLAASNREPLSNPRIFTE